MSKQLYPYWGRCAKSPTEKYIVTLENTNNIQAQNLFKAEKSKY